MQFDPSPPAPPCPHCPMPSESTLSGPTPGSIQVSGPGPWAPGPLGPWLWTSGGLCLRPVSRTLWPTGPRQTQAASLPWVFLPPGGWAQQVLEGRGDPAHSWWCHASRLILGGLPHLGASPQLYPQQGLRAAQAELPTTTSSLLPTAPHSLLSAPLSPKVSGPSSLPLPSTPTSLWYGHRTDPQHRVTGELADGAESLATLWTC